MELNWACLPEDLLVLILDRLVILSDYVRFSAVCMPWHTFALENYHGERRLKLSTHQLPLLFFPHTCISKEGETTLISIHNIIQKKTYELESYTPNSSQRWRGSSHGWLISVDKNFAITLSYPFCDEIIRLPPVSPKDCYHIEKVILSANPIIVPNDDYTVMVIYNLFIGELAFIRPANDKVWTYIERGQNVSDVIYSKGLFYSLDNLCSVNTCDISEHSPKINKVSPVLSPNLSPYDEVKWIKNYIVESVGGDLLQLLRFLDFSTHDIRDDTKKRITHVVTKGFKVFKLLVQNGEPKWVETRNLGDGVLFLGDNISTYVSASDFLGCHPNSIYFTEYCPPHTYFAPYDMGIFNLGDGSFQRDCVSNFLSSPVSMSPPIWIEPTFQGGKKAQP